MRSCPSSVGRSPSPIARVVRAAAVLACVAGGLPAVCAAQSEGLVQRPTEGPMAFRSATEAAIARDGLAVAPLRLGDIFLFSHAGADGLAPSGLRFSSGLFGPQRPFTLFESAFDPSPSQPYLGLGYSRAWPKSQVSLEADLGLTSSSGGNGARLRNLLTGGQNVDDAFRDFRWSPVMAVAVKYAF